MGQSAGNPPQLAAFFRVLAKVSRRLSGRSTAVFGTADRNPPPARKTRNVARFTQILTKFNWDERVSFSAIHLFYFYYTLFFSWLEIVWSCSKRNQEKLTSDFVY